MPNRAVDEWRIYSMTIRPLRCAKFALEIGDTHRLMSGSVTLQ